MMYMYLQKVISKITCVGIFKVTDEKSRIQIGSEDPDPYQNVTDPEHGLYELALCLVIL
jgi:hypothetical protein